MADKPPETDNPEGKPKTPKNPEEKGISDEERDAAIAGKLVEQKPIQESDNNPRKDEGDKPTPTDNPEIKGQPEVHTEQKQTEIQLEKLATAKVGQEVKKTGTETGGESNPVKPPSDTSNAIVKGTEVQQTEAKGEDKPLDTENDSGGEQTKTAVEQNNADNSGNPEKQEQPSESPETVLDNIDGTKEIDFEHPVVQEILKETGIDSIRNNPEMISFEEQLLNAADNHESGIGRERFQELIKTPTGELSEEDIKIIAEINESVEMPKNDTLMSKVVSERVYLDYITNGQYSSTIGGCLSKAQDMQDCYTFEDYYNALGLNYPGSEFDDADKMYVARFKSSETEKLITRGYGGNTVDDIQKVQEALGIDSRCTFEQSPPFTGTSHTLHVENGAGKMEYLPIKDENGNRQFCKIKNGSALYEINRDFNNEKLVGIRVDNVWWKVRYNND